MVDKQIELVYTPHNVLRILSHYSQLMSTAQYGGNWDALIACLDVASAIPRCNFTKRQSEVLYLRFICDLTVEECADVLGTGIASVRQHLWYAAKKIADVLNNGRC